MFQPCVGCRQNNSLISFVSFSLQQIISYSIYSQLGLWYEALPVAPIWRFNTNRSTTTYRWILWRKSNIIYVQNDGTKKLQQRTDDMI